MAAFRYIAEDVLRFGPCWGHNGFSFEGLNKLLKEMILSTTNYETKAIDLWNNYSFFHSFFDQNPILIKKKQKKIQKRKRSYINICGFEYAMENSPKGKKHCSTAEYDGKVVHILSQTETGVLVRNHENQEEYEVPRCNYTNLKPLVQSFILSKYENENSEEENLTETCFVEVLNISDLL